MDKKKTKVRIDFTKAAANSAKDYASKNQNENKTKTKSLDYTKALASGGKEYSDKNLNESKWEDIFSPGTLNTLKGKSGESLRQMLGNKNLMQAMMESQQLLMAIAKAEEGYTDVLEQLAIEIVTKAYPIIDYANIKIDAKLSFDLGANNTQPDEEEEEEPEMNFPQPDIPTIDFEEEKRRIINGITQGSAIRGSFAYLAFREYLDAIDESLVEKYGQILKLAFGIYDSDEAIAMMLAMLAQGQKIEGGSSEAEYQEGEGEEEGGFVIKARAIIFPILVHEIVKGLYEIVSIQGFGTDNERNKSIINRVDKLSNEPEDLRYGKFIYDAISNLYNDSDYDDPRVREFLFTEIYKLEDADFISFVENAINGTLNRNQKLWVEDTMRDIASDLRKDDTGLEDLLESVIKKKILLEVSIEQLRAQFADKIPTPVFDEIVAAVGQKSAYATWLTKKVADKIIKSEDIYKFKNYFDTFERNKAKYPFKDINQYKTSSDLAKFISASVEIKKKEAEDPSQQKGVAKEDKYKEFYIGEVDGFKVYEVPKGRKDLYGMSCELGSGTEWCTATGKTRSHFDSYISDGPLFIFVKGNEKYQFHYETNSFMDADDNPIF
jgi:hypothetical protein